MKEIKIREYPINWGKLFLNMFDRKNFGRNYILKIYKQISLNFIISDYDFERNITSIKLYINYPFDNEIKKDFTFLFIWNNNFNVENIKSQIYKKYKRLIYRQINRIKEIIAIRENIRYYTPLNTITEEKIKNNHFGNDYKNELININNISNKDIRDNAISSLINIIYKEMNKSYNEIILEYALGVSNDIIKDLIYLYEGRFEK